MATKTKTVEVTFAPVCDICSVEFSASKPNPAKYDGVLYTGQWATACIAHASNLANKVTKYLVTKSALSGAPKTFAQTTLGDMSVMSPDQKARLRF